MEIEKHMTKCVRKFGKEIDGDKWRRSDAIPEILKNKKKYLKDRSNVPFSVSATDDDTWLT